MDVNECKDDVVERLELYLRIVDFGTSLIMEGNDTKEVARAFVTFGEDCKNLL